MTIPLGLELALYFGWHSPFYFLSAIALAVFLVIWLYFPSLTSHLQLDRENLVSTLDIFQKPAVLIALITMPTVFTGNFMVIPNIAAYIQHNLGYPRASMSALYLVGGIAALFTTQIGGRLCDRWGTLNTNRLGTSLLFVPLVLGFMLEPSPLPVWLIFMSFMGASSLRNVSFFAYSATVPDNSFRARYMSIQSAMNHVSISLGAFFASLLLSETPDKMLHGMHIVAFISLLIGLTTPFLLARAYVKSPSKVSTV
jgi:predicted MFS family arabinose efflux permease